MIARTTLIISGSLAFVGQLGHDQKHDVDAHGPTQESVYSLSLSHFFLLASHTLVRSLACFAIQNSKEFSTIPV
jgi:hypothetical protein